MQTTEMRAMTFRLSAELLEQFKQAAAAENRSTAGALRNLMETRVAQYEADRESSETGAAA